MYSKFFVRHSFIEKHGCKNSLVVVDNSLSLGIVDLNIKYLQANHFRKLNFEKGYSILLENFLYSKKQIQFNYYLLNSKRNFLSYIPLFFKKLRALRSSKKILILINAKRGGFRCFFNGTSGFFPFKHFFHLIWLKEKQELRLLFNREKNKKIESKNDLKFLFPFFYNKGLWQKFRVRLNKSFNKKFEISFLKLLRKILLLDKSRIASICFIINLVLKEKFLKICKDKLGTCQKLFNLNSLLVKKGCILPRSSYVFVFYKLKFKIKNNYYNFSMGKRTKLKRRKNMFFKSRVKLVFLSFMKPNFKKGNVLNY